jgi:two-component system response regulator AtoC
MNKILIVDDDRNTCEILSTHLKERGFEVAAAFSGKEGLARVKSFSPTIILLDNRLPDISGLSVLKQVQSLKEEIFVIMITAYVDMETTIQAMKAGAFEYINKPIITEELDIVIHKIRGIVALKRRVDYFVDEESTHFRIDNIVGKTPQMLEIFKTIAIASESNATVLIEGESGTGKELIARAIHYHSNRNTPFIGINCSALVDTLLESELFGHEKGSFTGAVQRKEGKFEQAENGTLLLDEVGDMSLSLQAKLLRVIQEREFERVGGKEKIRSNVRIIAATNKNLEEMIKLGRFRKDLYYRLKVISIKVPSLRERLEDIPAIVHHLLNKINQTLHKNVKRVSPKVLDILTAYGWPGNIRELENVLTRAVALTRGEVLLEEAFAPFADIRQPSPTQTGFLSLKNLEREHVLKVLHFTAGHKGEACRILGISRPALERKIRRYQISLSGLKGKSAASSPPIENA